MQKIIPFLWFDNQAEEAVSFYTSIFKDSAVGVIDRYNAASAEISNMPQDSVMAVEFEILGQQFVALNGGPAFQFTPSISFFVHCQTKTEVEELWNQLSHNGTVLMPLDTYPFSEKYGWIQDKYGVSWQLILSGEVEQKIVPSLLFVGDKYGQAEEAIKHYTSIFNDSNIGEIARYGEGQEPNKAEALMYADFILSGQKFSAMDSGLEHAYTFSEAISLLVNCETQKEIDLFWDKLSADPTAEQCGWLKDKFGVSWQIVPTRLNELLRDSDPEKAHRVTQSMLQMKKIEIDELERAYASQ